jgi:hypothetical protein
LVGKGGDGLFELPLQELELTAKRILWNKAKAHCIGNNSNFSFFWGKILIQFKNFPFRKTLVLFRPFLTTNLKSKVGRNQ